MTRVLVVLALLAVAVAVDVATGAALPGRMAAFSLAGAFVLVLGAKALGRAGLQREGDRA